MKSKVVSFKTLVILIVSFFFASVSASNDGGGGLFENSGDIGSPQLKGSFNYNASTKVYTLTGAGTNLWAEQDEFFMAWKKESGNFSLSAKIAFEGKGVNPHRKLGIMIRESLTGASKYADVAIHGDGLTSLQYRDATGQVTKEVVATNKSADHITLERIGNKIIMKTGIGQFAQEATGEIELNFSGVCYVGFFVCSHESNVTEKAHFSEVQYKSYPPQSNVTSVLEILDVTNGQRTTVKEFPFLIEAPNWTPDGKWLIYNSGGKLYKISPSSPEESILINTDFASRCNNDHLLTTDGKQIAISHGTKEDSRSRVYTVPIEGGVPRLITPLAPSYLHGWSPDNNYLAYCAERNGNFDVYIIPAEGGEEIRLTTDKGLDDGPEYSPDGQSIWFNSVRSGLMQVWRMRPDGSKQTQITFDEESNAWFPHVSPDGKQVIYITYKKGDLAPDQHLPNKNVELRLIPATGGEPKTLAKLFGGQGTINVNSWAPDSKRVAFVSYRLNK